MHSHGVTDYSVPPYLLGVTESLRQLGRGYARGCALAHHHHPHCTNEETEAQGGKLYVHRQSVNLKLQTQGLN